MTTGNCTELPKRPAWVQSKHATALPTTSANTIAKFQNETLPNTEVNTMNRAGLIQMVTFPGSRLSDHVNSRLINTLRRYSRVIVADNVPQPSL
jgi:hypothetical protein